MPVSGTNWLSSGPGAGCRFRRPAGRAAPRDGPLVPTTTTSSTGSSSLSAVKSTTSYIMCDGPGELVVSAQGPLAMLAAYVWTVCLVCLCWAPSLSASRQRHGTCRC